MHASSQYLCGAGGCDGTEGADLRSQCVGIVDVQVLPSLVRTISVLLALGLLTRRVHSATAPQKEIDTLSDSNVTAIPAKIIIELRT